METNSVDLFQSLVGAQIVAWNQINSALREVEKMSAARFMLLNFLAQSPSGAGVAELAASQRITVGAASKLCDRLEKDGLLQRLTSETDQRRQIMSLTPLGRNLLAQSRVRVRGAAGDFFAKLTQAQQSKLAEMLALLNQ